MTDSQKVSKSSFRLFTKPLSFKVYHYRGSRVGYITRRLVAFLVGLVLCIIILEIGLRVVGSVYSHLSETDTTTQTDTHITVLAIGDSVTFGIGAPIGFSYPAQLQSIINKEVANKQCTVVNRGRPGQNTAQILPRVEGWLRQFKPSVVTILLGAQNQVNYFGFHEFLERTDESEKSLFLKSYDLLDRIRVYRFFSRLIRERTVSNHVQSGQDDWPDRYQPEEILTPGSYLDETGKDVTNDCMIGAEYRENGDFEAMLQTIIDTSRLGEISAGCYNIVGSMFKDKNRNEEAVTWFKQGIKRDPGRFDNYEEVGWLYLIQGRPKEALSWFQTGFSQARSDTLHQQSYIGIAQAFGDTDDIDGGIAFFREEKKRRSGVDKALRTLVNDYLVMFENKKDSREIHRWIEADIEKLIRLCRRYQAKIILQNYPAEPEVSSIYKKMADRLGTGFVDHEKIFKRYIQGKKRSSEVFAPDGHPNQKGYGMMAKNLWIVLKKGMDEREKGAVEDN